MDQVTPQQAQPQQAQPTFNPQQSQPTTAATSAQSLSPNSIGDFFGTGGTYFTILGSPYFAPNAAAAGGNVGRQKFSENVSPIPRDRVFVNYSFFQNTPLTADGADVNRFTPGFEKTFQDGNMSLEFRVPFASTVDSTFSSIGEADTSEFEWGDLTMFLKALLYNNDEIAIAGGLGFSFPTHDAFVVQDPGDTPIIKAESAAIHALPYLAALWTPNDQLFVQTYGQIDTDLNGGAVYVNEGGGAVNAGRLQDQTYLFLTATAGYWIYQNPCGNIRGIAPVVEFHYSRSLNDADAVATAGGTGVSGGDDDLSLLNSVVGVNVFMHDSLQLQAGYGFPLSGADDQFDGELRITLNWLFGGGNMYSTR